MRPLVAEWDAARARVAAAMAERAELPRERSGAGAEALALARERGIKAESLATKTTLRRAADRRTRKLAALLSGTTVRGAIKATAKVQRATRSGPLPTYGAYFARIKTQTPTFC